MNWLGLHWLDWVVLVLYFIGIAGIGIWSATKVKDMTDFFMGGRRFGKVFMMFFAFGAGTSSEQAVTVIAGTWRSGLVGIWWQLVWLFATPFLLDRRPSDASNASPHDSRLLRGSLRNGNRHAVLNLRHRDLDRFPGGTAIC